MVDLLLTPRIAALYELQAALMEPELKRLGINWTTFQLLMSVRSQGGNVSQASVARNLGITPATLSEAVAVQVRKGLLKQQNDPADKRVRTLSLTPKAEKLMDQVTEVISEVEKITLKGIGNSTTSAGVKLLDKCIDNLERAQS